MADGCAEQQSSEKNEQDIPRGSWRGDVDELSRAETLQFEVNKDEELTVQQDASNREDVIPCVVPGKPSKKIGRALEAIWSEKLWHAVDRRSSNDVTILFYTEKRRLFDFRIREVKENNVLKILSKVAQLDGSTIYDLIKYKWTWPSYAFENVTIKKGENVVASAIRKIFNYLPESFILSDGTDSNIVKISVKAKKKIV